METFEPRLADLLRLLDRVDGDPLQFLGIGEESDDLLSEIHRGDQAADGALAYLALLCPRDEDRLDVLEGEVRDLIPTEFGAEAL